MEQLERFKKAIEYLKTKATEPTNEGVSRLLRYSAENYISDVIGESKPINKQLLKRMVEFSINPDWIETGDGEMISAPPVEYKSPSADYLAGQLAMAERLIAKLEENNEEAKADKNKLFEALAETRQTINELLKPMVTSLKEIPPVLDVIVRNSNEHDKEIMKALDHLVGNAPGALQKESGKRILKGAVEQQRKGKA